MQNSARNGKKVTQVIYRVADHKYIIYANFCHGANIWQLNEAKYCQEWQYYEPIKNAAT